eukprot:4510619-Prymnesium_polylepis.1
MQHGVVRGVPAAYCEGVENSSCSSPSPLANATAAAVATAGMIGCVPKASATTAHMPPRWTHASASSSRCVDERHAPSS